MSENVAHEQLRSYFDRWSRLEEEKAAISDDLRELFAEMKSNGFDTKVARKVFRDRGADANERAEFEAIYDLYWSALDGPRVGRADARVEIVEEFAADVAATKPVHNVEAPSQRATAGENFGVTGGESAATSLVSHSAAEGAPRPGGECGAEPRQTPVQPKTASEMDGGAIAAVKGQARPASVVDAEPSPSSILREPRLLRPFCQNRESCAGSGGKHCYSCGKLAAAHEAEAA